MTSDHDESKRYEEDHPDRDDYPEEVWNQIEAERRRLEGEGDGDDLDEFTAPPEPEPPSFTEEQLKELEEDRVRMEQGEYPRQVDSDKGEPFDPF
jgi:hypothetical protein